MAAVGGVVDLALATEDDEGMGGEVVGHQPSHAEAQTGITVALSGGKAGWRE